MRVTQRLLITATLIIGGSAGLTAQPIRPQPVSRHSSIVFNNDGLRERTYDAIAQWPPLAHYLNTIRVTSNAGCITLEGVVENKVDRDNIGIRANAVRGTFWVDNRLQVRHR